MQIAYYSVSTKEFKKIIKDFSDDQRKMVINDIHHLLQQEKWQMLDGVGYLRSNLPSVERGFVDKLVETRNAFAISMLPRPFSPNWPKKDNVCVDVEGDKLFDMAAEDFATFKRFMQIKSSFAVHIVNLLDAFICALKGGDIESTFVPILMDARLENGEWDVGLVSDRLRSQVIFLIEAYMVDFASISPAKSIHPTNTMKLYKYVWETCQPMRY